MRTTVYLVKYHLTSVSSTYMSSLNLMFSLLLWVWKPLFCFTLAILPYFLLYSIIPHPPFSDFAFQTRTVPFYKQTLNVQGQIQNLEMEGQKRFAISQHFIIKSLIKKNTQIYIIYTTCNYRLLQQILGLSWFLRKNTILTYHLAERGRLGPLAPSLYLLLIVHNLKPILLFNTIIIFTWHDYVSICYLKFNTQRRVQPDQCYFTVQITGINCECNL